MTQIGRYDIVRKTGTHGLTAVYEAFDTKMQRPVTIRIAERGNTDPGISEEQVRSAILTDAQQLAKLDHPHLIKVLACEESEGDPFLVLEQFEGRALTSILSERETLPGNEVAEILKNAGAGLDHAHEYGLIYRNLSTDSILMSDDGLLKISGFEIGRIERQMNGSAEDAEILFRSVRYLAPELLRGEAAAGSDQYSLAAIACRLLTGKELVAADSLLRQMYQILFEPLACREALASKGVGALAPVIEKALSKDVAARFASCAEMAAAFSAALAGKGASLTRVASITSISGEHRNPTAPEPLTARDLSARLDQVRPARSLLPWIIATAAIVVLAAIAAMMLLRRTPPKPVVQPASVPPVTAPAAAAPAPAPVTPPAKVQKAAKSTTTKPRAKKPEPESAPPAPVEIRGAQPKVKIGTEKQDEDHDDGQDRP